MYLDTANQTNLHFNATTWTHNKSTHLMKFHWSPQRKTRQSRLSNSSCQRGIKSYLSGKVRHHFKMSLHDGWYFIFFFSFPITEWSNYIGAPIRGSGGTAERWQIAICSTETSQQHLYLCSHFPRHKTLYLFINSRCWLGGSGAWQLIASQETSACVFILNIFSCMCPPVNRHSGRTWS